MKDPLAVIAEGTMMKDILDAQAEHLIQGVDDDACLRLFPRLRERLEPLMLIAQHLKDALVPTRPSTEFRESLRAGLLTAARQRSPSRSLWPSHSWRPQKEWVIGAAAVGSAVSLAGVAAFLIRRAQLSQQQPAQQDVA